ncbi:MAG: PIN domain-containing protein [Zoogloea sp.]|nr:PIN domain-containing protein [Zoogloea sp.]
MAGHARYTVVIDACVFYSMLQSDALMSLCTRGLFAVKWSVRIENEWIRALSEKRANEIDKINRRRDTMRKVVPDWEVPETAVTRLEPCLKLPDPGDTHVLAAAIAGHADCIVTANLKDFPSKLIAPYGIEIVDPDRFIINQWDLDPIQAIAAFKSMRARWKRPETSPEDFAVAFDRVGLLASAQRLREVAELI